jgi:hypothetical protein
MGMRATFSGSQQIITEVCEHCGEKIRDLHISEIAFTAEDDPRTIQIRDVDNNIFELKKKRQRISELSESFKRKQLLDDTEAQEAFQKKTFKYGLRAEAMCSESIDIDAGVTQSFCYRVEANPDAQVFQKVVGGRTLSASLARSAKSDVTGSRMGVDRKGNVIKMNRYKNLRMDRPLGKEEVEKDASDREVERKKGAFRTSWFEQLRDDETRKRVIIATQNCERLVERFPDEVKTMEIVARARNLEEFDREYIQAFGCRL